MLMQIIIIMQTIVITRFAVLDERIETFPLSLVISGRNGGKTRMLTTDCQDR